MNIFRGKRSVCEKTLAEVSEIPVGIAGGSNPLIHLNDVQLLPGHVFGGQIAQHDPRSMATTHGDDKAAASSNSRPSFSGDKFSGFLCDGIRIGQDFDLHGTHFHSLPSRVDD